MRHALVLVGILSAALYPSLSEAQTLGPRTLLPVQLLCTDVPVLTTAPQAALTIAAVQASDGRRGMATGEVALLSAGTAQGVAVGQRFVARRVQTGLQPWLQRHEGWAALQTSGILTVTAVDDRFALARVDTACDTVDVGDHLDPLVMPTLPAAPAAGGPADFEARARVLFGKDRREAFGDGDILAIEYGGLRGVAPGAQLAIYRERTAGLPLVQVGEAVVLETTAEHARAVVVSVKDYIAAGDVVVMRTAQP